MYITRYEVRLTSYKEPVLFVEETKRFPQFKRTSCCCPEKIADLLREVFRLSGAAQENFVMCSFDTSNSLIGVFLVSKGSINRSYAPVREVCQNALLSGAVSIVIAHNHPSGDDRPSEADISVTKMVKEGLDTIGVGLLDHLVIGDGTYFSFLENGLL